MVREVGGLCRDWRCWYEMTEMTLDLSRRGEARTSTKGDGEGGMGVRVLGGNDEGGVHAPLAGLVAVVARRNAEAEAERRVAS